MGVVRIKDGVLFTKIAPGGFRMLSAIDIVAESLSNDLTITSACDGEHSGPNDPHHRGEAYDVRTHDFTPEQKTDIMTKLGALLNPEQFYFFLESPGTD